MRTKSLIKSYATVVLGAGLFLHGHASASEKESGTTAYSSQIECSDGTLTKFYKRSEAVQPLGAVLANISEFADEAAAVARERYGISDRLQVLAVLKDSIAERIGLRAGDVIVDLNGSYVPKGAEALAQLKSRILNQIDWSGAMSATVIRDGFAVSLKADAVPSGTASITHPDDTDS